MNTQDIVETWRREAIQEGIEQGIARSLIDIYEARFGALPEDLRVVIEDTRDEGPLRAWLKLAGTRSADEIAAAILVAIGDLDLACGACEKSVRSSVPVIR